MQNPVITLLLILCGIALGAAAVWFFRRAREEAAYARGKAEGEKETAVLVERTSRIPELEVQLQELTQRLEESRSEREKLAVELSTAQTALAGERKETAEKLKLLEEARDALANQFKVLANQIFEEKSAKFTEQNKERLGELLNPLNDKLREFEKTVRETYDKEGRERFSLRKEVERLHDMNQRLNQEAVNLTNALKGQSKSQGNWGEFILERVLEKSGLSRGREYEVQVALKGEDGNRLQPDVVVYLPEEKHLVIDAKVSLVAYERFCSAESDDERQRALREHVDSVRKHVRDLSGKNYQSLYGIKSLDFVLLFVPIEPSFAAAMQHDGDLFTEAFQRNIVIVSPSTLLATLRTIASIWRYEDQNRNALEIARQAANMYDRFVDFVQDLEKIGTGLKAVEKNYESAYKRLTTGRGHLVGRAEKIRQLGIRGSKELPKAVLDAAEDDADLEEPV
jgi:DNA recombination protein RmuC